MRRRYHVWIAEFDRPMERYKHQPVDGFEAEYLAEKRIEGILADGSLDSLRSFAIVKTYKNDDK